MNKRGQFFLIAALILATILIGLGAVYVSVNSPKQDATVYDLTKEISYEGSSVLASNVIAGSTQSAMESNITQLAQYYLQTYPGINITIVYGDKNNLYLLTTNSTNTGAVGIGTGGDDSRIQITKLVVGSGPLNPSGDEVEIKISENSDPIKFKIIQGQNFYIVIKKNTGGETVVGSNLQNSPPQKQ